jgi:hypothetical protein
MGTLDMSILEEEEGQEEETERAEGEQSERRIVQV